MKMPTKAEMWAVIEAQNAKIEALLGQQVPATPVAAAPTPAKPEPTGRYVNPFAGGKIAKGTATDLTALARDSVVSCLAYSANKPNVTYFLNAYVSEKGKSAGNVVARWASWPPKDWQVTLCQIKAGKIIWESEFMAKGHLTNADKVTEIAKEIISLK